MLVNLRQNRLIRNSLVTLITLCILFILNTKEVAGNTLQEEILGGVNLNGYCLSKGWDRAKLTQNNAYGWVCERDNGETTGLDMYAVCHWQYGGHPTPEYKNFSDPNSWVCVSTQSDSNGSSGESGSGGSGSNSGGDSGGSGGSNSETSSCRVEFFNNTPGSPVSVGTDVFMHGKGSCDGGVRAVRFTVDGDSKSETSLPEQTAYFRTNEYGPGTHKLCFWVAGGSDGRWGAGAKECKTYTVTDNSSNPSDTSNEGGVDLQVYCQSKGWARAKLIQNNAYGWVCERDNGETTGLDMYAVCHWQYGGHPTPEYKNFSDPNSWVCVSSQSKPSGGSDGGGSGTNKPLEDPPSGSSNCKVEFFTTTPSSPVAPGQDVLMHGKGSCPGGVRAVRFTVGGDSKSEIALPEQTAYFRANEYGLGTHTLCFWVAGGADGRWESGTRKCKTYVVTFDTSGGGSGGDQFPEDEPPSTSCTRWRVGARVGLRGGAEIRTGSGVKYTVHTRVPHDNWQVDIIGGPRYADGLEWWDISRRNLDGGGTGWVYIEQAGFNTCGRKHPPKDSPITPPEELPTSPQNESPPANLEDLDISGDQTNSGILNWCRAKVEAVDEGGGTLIDREFFLYVWIPNELDKTDYQIEFLGFKKDLAIWNDAGDYLRYGIPTGWAYITLSLWRNSSLWAFWYRC